VFKCTGRERQRGEGAGAGGDARLGAQPRPGRQGVRGGAAPQARTSRRRVEEGRSSSRDSSFRAHARRDRPWGRSAGSSAGHGDPPRHEGCWDTTPRSRSSRVAAARDGEEGPQRSRRCSRLRLRHAARAAGRAHAQHDRRGAPRRRAPRLVLLNFSREAWSTRAP
jgi:hypothetical protein